MYVNLRNPDETKRGLAALPWLLLAPLAVVTWLVKGRGVKVTYHDRTLWSRNWQDN